MKVKKRTVWFLTVVSLAAVISVFYIFEDNTPNILTIFSDETIDETDILGVNQNLTQPVNSESDLFQEVRLELANKRSQQKEQLTQKIAADEFTAEEKNEAFNEMDELIKLESSEAMLEMLVKSIGYSDALVRIEGDKVQVRVMSDEVSNKMANEIMFAVRSEFKDFVNVSVEFEPFN